MLRTFHLAGPGVGAGTESEFVHLCNHSLSPACSLNLTLRKKCERADSCSHKEHCRTVLAGGNTGTATNTSCAVHTFLSIFTLDRNGIGIRDTASADRNISSRLKYLVKSLTVHNKVLDYRETLASPRLDGDGVTILELAHMELAGGNLIVRSVSTSVDVK